MIASHASKGARRYRYYVSANLQHGGDAADTDGMRIPAPEIETLVSNKLAEIFDDPIGLMERTAGSSSSPAGLALSPDAAAKAVAGSRTIAETLRGSDTASIARLVALIVQRVDVASDAVTITLDSQQIAERLGIVLAQSTTDRSVMDASRMGDFAPTSLLQITVPVKLKRSGWAMRLILPSGRTALSRVDDKLIKAIATAHGWWEELVENPGQRISDLAAAHGVTKSWVTRVLRLAFLDPAIVEQVLNGTAPGHLTLDTLRSPDSVLALWSAQRVHHRISDGQ